LRSYSRERGGTAAAANSLRATGTAFVRMRKASLLRRERLLSILVGGSEKGDFGIRAVNSKSSAAQHETATRAEFVKCALKSVNHVHEDGADRRGEGHER